MTAKFRRRGLLLLAVLLIVGGGLLYWQLAGRQGRNREAAVVANQLGVGYLERYDSIEADGRTAFDHAAEQFQSAMALAPDWTTAKLNYGMSQFFTGQDEKIDRAVRVFEGVLKDEPTNPYANHCLGIIYFYRGDADTANRYFKAVTTADPADAYAWYFRGFTTPDRESSEEAKECLEKAVQFDPYLTTARFSLAAHLSINDPKVRAQMHQEIAALRAAFWERTADTKPSKLGKYGTPIGSSPVPPAGLDPLPPFEQTDSLRVTLEAGTTWAATVDGPARAIRERFGGTLVRLDYDGDDRPDALLLSAVTRNGKLGDVLLHNDGGGRFTDVTTAVGLAKTASLGAAVADFDNSGTPDLLLTHADGVRLLRNVGGKSFEDVTTAAGLDKLTGQFLSAGWCDLDQDGDLDLILAGAGGPRVFVNVGEAPPTPPNQPLLPLGVKFQPFEHAALTVPGPTTAVVTCDLDADGDVDLLVLGDGQPPVVILNDRLLRFHRGDPLGPTAARWNGGLVFDLNRDDQSDLVLLPVESRPVILASSPGRFTSENTDTPSVLQGHAVDLDHDGRTDLVGLSADHKPVVLRGDGKLLAADQPFGPSPAAIPDLLAVAACDVDGDCRNDLLAWSAAKGLMLFRNLDTRNHGLRLHLTGKREREAARTNHDAIGAKVTAYAGPVRTLVENATLSAGLGQSRLPLDFGIGRATTANAVRIAWPDVVPQAEVAVPSCEVRRIPETDRRSSSCPVLFTWDGTGFRYVTDFLGAGSVGELGADGGTRPPRPEESVKIEAGQLAVRDGKFTLVVAEPMDELLYLDHLRLDVIDHPADAVVYPDERFATADPPPSQDVLSFRQRFAAVRATDRRGQDVTATLAARDGRTADGFRRRAWHGFAEDHFVELDFGSQLAGLKADAAVYLVLAGWTDYAYPETIYAAQQAGVPMKPPVLEKLAADGSWVTVGEIGFPAGLPRVMTSPVRGLAGSATRRLRIRTNMHVYWDQIQIAVAERSPPPTYPLAVTTATLAHRGFAKEVHPNGRRSADYDHARLEPATYSRWPGKITRLGDVTKLLTAHDDCFVICGPGDEIEVSFDAAGLPPVPAGHVRSFVLRSRGYCKDAAPFTATFGSVSPLPFRDMKSFPPGNSDRRNAPAGQAEYDRVWNTRTVGPR